MPQPRTLETGLLILRVSIGAFFLVWSIEKIVAPELARRVFEAFYFSSPGDAALIATGIVQTAIVLAFLAGLWRLWTYGAILVMHTVSVASTWERLLTPYELPNHLFWAAVPVWAAILLLFLLRTEDRLLSVDEARRRARGQA